MKILLFSLIILSNLWLSAEVLHSEKSLYRNIIVEEKRNLRCMVFGLHSKNPDNQSCFDTDRPDYLVFSYTKLVMAGLSTIPAPENVLIIGLGGGTLPMTIEELFPKTQIDTVELDEAVLQVAKKWFYYKESNRQKTHLLDGRVFVKRQLRLKRNYDLIILDAFNGDYIPEHLMTMEFFDEIKALLGINGLLIANTFSNNKLYHHESVTYQSIFGNFYYIHSSKTANRVIFVSTGKYHPLKVLPNISLNSSLNAIGVDLVDFEERLTQKRDWNENARPLTDQFSPANLLN
ncbi:MAG: spermidine synthase [Gammaproteobacteria bacterium]|nr:spermidine synthase [Gammaproteobacteria bacterium]